MTGRGDAATIHAGLSRLRLHWRIAALVQVVLISALLGLCALALSQLFEAVPIWTALVITIAAMVIGLALTVSRSPSATTLARRADYRLLLSEKLSTALEVEGTATGVIGRTLLAQAASAAETLDTRRFAPLLPRAARWGIGGLAVVAAAGFLASQVWTQQPIPTAPPEEMVASAMPTPAVDDVVELAEQLEADAALRDDPVARDAAKSLRNMADRMAADPDAVPGDEVAQLMTRAASSYAGKPHDLPPFVDPRQTADRNAPQQNQPAGRAGTGIVGTDAQAGGAAPVDPSAPLSTISLPGAGDAVSLGIKPDGGPSDPLMAAAPEPMDDGDTQEFGMAMDSGKGESNMTGTGSEETIGEAAPELAANQPTEAMELTAQTTVDGARVRTSEPTPAQASTVQDLAFTGDWQHETAPHVARETIPAAAASAVARYFARDPDAMEPRAQ